MEAILNTFNTYRKFFYVRKLVEKDFFFISDLNALLIILIMIKKIIG